jgi:hypothetical protein
LAKATEGLTGSEIENLFIKALYLAFDGGKKPGQPMRRLICMEN